MKTTVLGLRTVIYKVGNMTEAKAWYTEAFKTEPYFDEPYYVGFNIGGYELGLQPDESITGTNVATYWGVNDIHESYDHFLSIGAVSDEAPTNVGGDLMVATVKDPWGNLLGLIYNPDFRLRENY